MLPFNWEDIDHSLVHLKTTNVAEKMRKSMKRAEACIRHKNRGNLNDHTVPTLILKMKVENADRWTRRIYDIYCDVWETQGYPKSAAFIRAVRSQAIVPILGARANTIAGEFTTFAWQTNFSPETRDQMLKNLNLEMERLQTRWVRQLEVEALECEHAARRENRLRTELVPSSPPTSATEPARTPPAALQSALTDQTRREAVIRKVRNPERHTLLLIDEAALYYQVESRTIHRWITDGKLRKGGRRSSVTIESIQNWDKKRSRKPRSS
jgi:hypothetical protein